MSSVLLRALAAILLFGAGFETTDNSHEAVNGTQWNGHRTEQLGNLLNTVSTMTIDFGAARSADVLFDPVRLNAGEQLSLALVTASGETIGRFDLTQTSPTTTEIGFEKGISTGATGLGLDVETRYGGVVTKSLSLETMPYYDLGVVTSVDGPWLKTWHYECDDNGCVLILDPDDTSIDFRADNDGSVAFRTIHVQLPYQSEMKQARLSVRRSVREMPNSPTHD